MIGIGGGLLGGSSARLDGPAMVAFDAAGLTNTGAITQVATAAPLRVGAPASILNAGVGDIVLPNGARLRGVRSDGTDTIAMIGVDVGANGSFTLGPLPIIIKVGNPGSTAGAVTGDMVYGNAKALRGANAAGTASKIIARLNATDQVEIGEANIPVALVSDLIVTNPNNWITLLSGSATVSAMYRVGRTVTEGGFFIVGSAGDFAAGSAVSDMGISGVAGKSVLFALGNVLKASISATQLNLAAGIALAVNATQVVGPRVTGYSAMTGAADKATVYAVGTVTLAQLAGRVMQLQADLTTHGLIGP